MLKFLHAADIHLDSPLLGLERYEGAPVEEIRCATRQAMQNLTELAIQEKVKFLLICGDLYDGDWKDYNTGLFLVKEMARLREAGIRVFIISGNHDAESNITRSLKMPENVYRFSTKKAETKMMEDLGVAIHGQGFASRAVMDNLSVAYPKAIPNFFNIGMLHTSVNGREDSEPYAPCSKEDLLAKGYDYWALGHVHNREIVHNDPYIIFPGNIQGRHIKESGAKGCTLVTVEDGGSVVIKHLDLDLVRWDICTVDVSGAESPEDIIEKVRSEIKIKINDNDYEEHFLAMRLLINGRCKAHDKVALNPEKWKMEIRAMVADESGGKIWIEKIKLNTATKIDLDDLMKGTGPLADLLVFIDEISPAKSHLPEYEEDILGLKKQIAAELARLQSKLPAEIRNADEWPNPEDPKDFHDLLKVVKQLLISTLLAQGDAS